MIWSKSFLRMLFFVCTLFQVSLVSAMTDAFGKKNKSENDSTERYRRSDEFKKNSVRLDVLGKSVVFGFAYDRIVYHEKFDVHVNAGLFPVQLFDRDYHSFNLAAYYSTNHKDRWNYIAGLGYSYNLRISDEFWVTHYTDQSFMAMVGFNVALHEKWDAQILWTPALILSEEHIANGDLGGGFWGIWYWGGVNVGYKF